MIEPFIQLIQLVKEPSIRRFETKSLFITVDGYIKQEGLDAPQEPWIGFDDGFNTDIITELNLDDEGIKTIIWATGYSFDYSMIKLPVTDDDGYPVQKRGISESEGLYFVGLVWLYKPKSSLIFGVGEDAEYIAGYIAQAKDQQIK